MARNLSRNTKLIVSTVTTGFSTANTFEIPPLDGYSFSQSTGTTEIGLNEAGANSVRGFQSFNSSINPVDVSFTTYVRPYKSGVNHTAIEKLLWNAMVSNQVGLGVTESATDLAINFANSNVDSLLSLHLYFVLDRVAYRVDGFVINTAEVDFSIDGIAQITWTGFGDSVTEDYDPLAWVAGTHYLGASNIGVGGADASFIRNKLTTLAITDNGAADLAAVTGAAIGVAGLDVTDPNFPVISLAAEGIASADQYVGGFIKFTTSANQLGKTYTISSSTTGTPDTVTIVGPFNGTVPADGDVFDIYANPSDHVGTTYNVAITGGTLTVDNGITFLTPAELGVVNKPIAGFTGSRKITSSLTAYLNTGHDTTAGLLNFLANDTSSVNNSYSVVLTMGGAAAPNVAFTLGTAQLTIPTIDTADIISTTIAMTGLGSTGLEDTDELTISYKSP